MLAWKERKLLAMIGRQEVVYVEHNDLDQIYYSYFVGDTKVMYKFAHTQGLLPKDEDIMVIWVNGDVERGSITEKHRIMDCVINVNYTLDYTLVEALTLAGLVLNDDQSAWLPKEEGTC